jgi:hypothetical protein
LDHNDRKESAMIYTPRAFAFVVGLFVSCLLAACSMQFKMSGETNAVEDRARSTLRCVGSCSENRTCSTCSTAPSLCAGPVCALPQSNPYPYPYPQPYPDQAPEPRRPVPYRGPDYWVPDLGPGERG